MTPESIGRYRIVRLLGSGGMGEVFEGYDDRLQRPVAIKGLHHDRVSPDRRERLRREALSTAALSHPAITHIYEILTEGDTDWVVMEFVDGSSLADVLGKGPPSPAEVASIGAEIAEALAEAHRRGIVHRDIKTENVMLTPTGHVKVLDFGLAKWVGVRAASDDRITTDGIVVGTSKAMSPEQALGKEVDSRSDIFSLGSTLYELATGRPAFRGTTPMETMHKVARCECEPLAEVGPDLPEALVSVIERCMACDPKGRYQTADELARDLRRVAASATDATEAAPAVRSSQVFVRARRHWVAGAAIVAVLTVAAAVAVKQGWLSPRKPLTVAVLPVQSPATDDAAKLASTAIEDAVVISLAALKNVIVVSGRDARAVSSPGKRVPDIARELGVREVVETSVTPGQAGQPIRVGLQRLDGRTGQVTWSEQLEVGTDDLILLQDRIVTALGDAYRGVPTSGHPASREATPEALKAYLQVKSRLDSGNYSKDQTEEITLLQAAIADAPRFFAPVASLAWRYRYVYQLYRRPADLDRCLALAKRARELAPDHPWVLQLEAWQALDRRDNDEALDRVRAWTSSRPGDSTAWQTLAVVLDRMGRYPESVTAFERSFALLPSWYTLYYLAESQELRGEFDGARQAIRRALEISPANLSCLGLLAEVEMYAGNNAEAERLYRDLVARRGERWDRIHLGNCLYYQNRLAEAAEQYQEAAEADRTNYLAVANLADTRLALGQLDLARAGYAEALRLCETEFERGLRGRPLLETRARCLVQLDRGPEAFLAIQEALREYGDNPATMYMAALVAAVAGDTNAALAWTGKALAAHAPAVWFAGPEFARLARDARFQALFPKR